MNIAAVIPARYGSTRFPGKPLADVAGRSLIRRVYDLASAAEGVSQAIVATDDERIQAHVEAFGGVAIMTPAECRNGTERVHAAIQGLDVRPDAVINLQGDAVLTPPWVIEAVAAEMRAHPELPMVTPAARLDASSLELLMEAKKAGEVGGTTVVFNRAGDALYFSKAVIPYVRDPKGGAPTFRHIGLYGYRTEALDELVAMPPSPLELTEGLEQLRALDNGMRIRVVEVDYRGRRHMAIDSPEDLKRVESLIAEDGELVPR
ncbi:MAG: 3-deoxy-manno-octulosonate cytidylyltransferase (CMP-KDO synthetase) [Planctomycetota bacterium]|jgi:3-deoxy-manno-octulosonate cytidylyltransferase (CMP-KDO synthetase)